jgi:2-dehydropantoate 2-reductase
VVVIGAGAMGGLFGGLLAEGGLDVTLVDIWGEHVAAIRRDKWKKLLGNVALGAVSAVTDLRSFEIMRVPELKEVVLRSVDEAAAVAKAEGIALDVAEAREVLMRLVDTAGGGTGTSKSSMREDIVRRRRTEIDTIHGAVQGLARRHGLPTPTIDTMIALVKGLESTYL